MHLPQKAKKTRYVYHKLTVVLTFLSQDDQGILAEFGSKRLAQSLEATCRKFDTVLETCEITGDRAVLRVSYPPKVALSGLINSLKGVSSRAIRAEESKQKGYSVFAWSPSYSAVSVASADNKNGACP